MYPLSPVLRGENVSRNANGHKALIHSLIRRLFGAVMLNLFAVLSRSSSQYRRRRRPVDTTVVCESLEDRQLLATAGISTNVESLTVFETAPVSFAVQWQPTGDGNANSVGMNLRIHYDSTALQFNSLTGVYPTGLSGQQETSELADRDDGDASTDRVVKLLWVDLDGTWPNLATGSNLVTVQFTALSGFGSSIVNVDATSVSDTPLPRAQVSITQNVRPLLTGPIGPSTSPRPEFTWTATPDAVGYEVWVANLSTGQNPWLRTNVETNSWIPADDLDIGRYAVWVEGIYGDGTRSGWSTQLVVEIRTQLSITAPLGTITTSTPLIEWEAAAGAERYDLWINNATTGEPQVIRDQHVSTDQYQAATPLPLGTYLAWVQGINTAGFLGTWSPAARFIVATPPTLLAPINPTFDSTPTFAWTSIVGADRYDLWVRNFTTGQDQVIRESNLTQTSFTAATPLPNAEYLWWVRAISNNGAASLWAGGRFSIGGRPELIGPVGTITDNTPTFDWTPVNGAASYDLWVDRMGGPVQIIRQPALTNNTFTPATSLPAGDYRFWVRAISDSGENSLWSLPLNFTLT